MTADKLDYRNMITEGDQVDDIASQEAAQSLDIIEHLERFEKQEENEDGAFPASILTPGQVESRHAYARLTAINREYPGKIPWWEAYELLREAGWTWRKACFIAWSVLPLNKRWPRTIEELATGVLGLHSARAIRMWRQKDPKIDLAIEKMRMMTLGDRLADVLDAWVTVASTPDPAAHRDRITYLEWSGIYKPRSALEVMGEGGGPVRTKKESEFEDLSDDDLERLISNLKAATGIAGIGAA